MDSLHLCIAFGPLAMYLVLLGAVNLSSRPLLTTGGRDLAAVAIGLGGMITAGPMELFMSESAAALYGGWVWAIMLTAYALCVLMLALMLKPRLVIYNMTPEQLRPLLAETALRLDSDARWAGESLVLPELGVQLYMDATPLLKNVQLIATSSEQNLPGWRRLETELAAALSKTTTTPNPLGAILIASGLLAAAGITWRLASDPTAVTQALNEMLRR